MQQDNNLSFAPPYHARFRRRRSLDALARFAFATFHFGRSDGHIESSPWIAQEGPLKQVFERGILGRPLKVAGVPTIDTFE